MTIHAKFRGITKIVVYTDILPIIRVLKGITYQCH